jgi:hypothetical protein
MYVRYACLIQLVVRHTHSSVTFCRKSMSTGTDGKVSVNQGIYGLQLAKKDASLNSVKSQFAQLKEDFLYNEGVLRERDIELADLEEHLHQTVEQFARCKEAEREATASSAAAKSELLIEVERYKL